MSYVELYDGPDGKSSGSGYIIAGIIAVYLLCVYLKHVKLNECVFLYN